MVLTKDSESCSKFRGEYPTGALLTFVYVGQRSCSGSLKINEPIRNWHSAEGVCGHCGTIGKSSDTLAVHS